MTTRGVVVFLMCLVVLVTVQRAAGDARMQAVMRTKLANTQSLLSAIVTSDYREIDRAAAALGRISEMEIVSWQNPPRPEYTEQAMLFLTTVDGLRAAGAAHNLDRVGAEYSTLVATCLHCHTYVRDARRASMPREATPLAGGRAGD